MTARKVLLVDDSSTTLMMERMILEKRTTYSVLTANSGEEAIEVALEEKPDLILMDVGMPTMSGFDACKLLRMNSHTKETLIILVTSHGEEASIASGFESGCNDYITKPISSGELVKMLQYHLGE